MTAPTFNPHQIEVLRFEQRLKGSADNGSPEYEFLVDLALREAKGAGFAVSRLSLTAIGSTAETGTVHAAIVLFLDAITTAISRARTGIRPGTP